MAVVVAVKNRQKLQEPESLKMTRRFSVDVYVLIYVHVHVKHIVARHPAL